MSSVCRLCATPLKQSFCDLGMSPLANSYLTAGQLDRPEVFYPLHAYVCMNCFLVQLAECESPENIFGDYLYFSSYSDSWLDHARTYAAEMIRRFSLDGRNQVIEIASNDGYLLQNFDRAGVPCLGIEPAKNVAAVAQARGIETKVAFFGTSLAKELTSEGIYADLLIGNNVLAHVPDINDFVAGMSIALSPDGLITMEFPHLLELIEFNQFDTIYHEHFSYFSLMSVARLFADHGLELFDVEQLSTHGGSLRIYACHTNYPGHPKTRRVSELIEIERASGLDQLEIYVAYPERVKRAKRALVGFLIGAQERGLSVVAYGAPAKGNTLLNYCGIGTDLVQYTVDRSPHKQGRFLPGTHLPICVPERVRDTQPDYLLILPWNLRDEIIRDMSYIREWGGKFVIPIPELIVVD